MVELISADWPAPDNIVAVSTTRVGGVSRPPYDSFNLAAHVGDDAGAVAENRARLLRSCAGLQHVQWLEQVHGTEVYSGPFVDAAPQADAVITAEPGVACAVLTADCLPVLLCDSHGRQVAAAHAGWRGLCAGVLRNTVAALDAAPAELMAWIGPAIGRNAFEVGSEVRQRFIDEFGLPEPFIDRAFTPVAGKPGHFLADLVALASEQLRALGVASISGGQYCSFSDAAQFFSYRRDGTTGRMATLIYRR